MATVSEIKDELQFNTELISLLEVMKNISVFRFHALQLKKRRFMMFDEKLKGFFAMIDPRTVEHPFIKPRTEKSCIVMITSDEGFMGKLNLQVIEGALAHPDSQKSDLIIVGERGTRNLREAGREFTAFRGAASAEERYALALELKDHILSAVKDGRLGRVFVFYPIPVSFLVHKVEVLELLPVSYEAAPAARNKEVIIESSLEGILDFLVEEDVFHKFIEILENSKLAEFASRAIHLEESNRDLVEREKALKFQYFRAHHENIDKNIRELFSAQIIGRKK